MKCLETRRRDGMKWRRYRTEDGRTVTTYEVPTTIMKSIGKTRLTAFLQAWERGEANRARVHRMKQLIEQGVKPTAIAHELGVTDAAVRIARQKLNRKKELADERK